MNDRDFITSIRDQCNTQLGGGSGEPVGQVAPVSAKPAPFADLGNGGNGGSEVKKTQIVPGQVVGVTFTIKPGSAARNLRWFGAPGQFWKRNSWAIFDSSGAVVFHEDNAAVVGTLGYALDQTGPLGKLQSGTFTLGVAVDSPSQPDLAFQFVQG